MHEDRYFGWRHAFPVVAEVDGASFHIVDGDDVTLDRPAISSLSKLCHPDDGVKTRKEAAAASS